MNAEGERRANSHSRFLTTSDRTELASNETSRFLIVRTTEELISAPKLFEAFIEDAVSTSNLSEIITHYIQILVNKGTIKRSKIERIFLIPYTDVIPRSVFYKSLEDNDECRVLRFILLILDNMFEDWSYRARVFRFLMSLGDVKREDFLKLFHFHHGEAYTLRGIEVIYGLKLIDRYRELAKDYSEFKQLQIESCVIEHSMWYELMEVGELVK